MRRIVLVVSGDAGAFRVQEPVVDLLKQEPGIRITILAEDSPGAKAKEEWVKAGAREWNDVGYEEVDPKRQRSALSGFIERSQVVAIGSCGKAVDLELAAAKIAKELGKTLVVMSDGLYNHGEEPWGSIKPTEKPWSAIGMPDYWLAINSTHQRSIVRGHGFSEKQVPITGNPQLDELSSIGYYGEVRARVREEHCIADKEKWIIWWSSSRPDLMHAQLGYILLGLDYLASKGHKLVFSPRIHNTYSSFFKKDVGYIQAANEYISLFLGRAGGRTVITTERAAALALGADITVGVIGTTPCSISPILGRPTVFLFTPADEQEVKEQGFEKPYALEVRVGAALAAFSAEEVGPTLDNALRPETEAALQKAARENLELVPNSAQKTADFILDLLQK